MMSGDLGPTVDKLLALGLRLDELRAFEHEYMARLRAYFEDRLAELDPHDTVALRSAMVRIENATDADLAEVVLKLPRRQADRLIAMLLCVPVEVTP
jgi:hypothetical protein